METTLDEVDRGILHRLQEDARNNTAPEIAEHLDVSANTVRNRIERLETNGVVEGYAPHIDYETAGYQLRVLLVCSVAINDREELATEAMTVEGVVRVSELLSGHENLVVEAVAEGSDDLTTIASELESLGITIRDEKFFKSDRVQPFDHFGTDAVEE